MAQAGFYAGLYNSHLQKKWLDQGLGVRLPQVFLLLKKDKHTDESRKFNQNHQKNVPNIRKLDII